MFKFELDGNIKDETEFCGRMKKKDLKHFGI